MTCFINFYKMLTTKKNPSPSLILKKQIKVQKNMRILYKVNELQLTNKQVIPNFWLSNIYET